TQEGRIGLVMPLCKLYGARRAAQKYHEQARGHRVQCAGVADAPLPRQPPQPAYYVVARPALGLVHEQDTAQSSGHFSSIARSMSSSASSGPASSVQPAAMAWPPPP